MYPEKFGPRKAASKTAFTQGFRKYFKNYPKSKGVTTNTILTAMDRKRRAKR